MITTTSPVLRVRSLSNHFDNIRVLSDVNFDLFHAETLAVLGESGCGKTTLLRILAGLIPFDTGTVELGGRSLNGVTPRDRAIVYLDQESLLFEHLTVYENIAFAMRMKRRSQQEIDTSVTAMLQSIDLTEHARKRSWQLSGGQKQRVAFARAVLSYPQVLLLDEPFCSLDGRNRHRMQSLFQEICKRYQITAIFVTHDLKEALLLGSRFALMSAGQLRIYESKHEFSSDQATGIPEEIRFWSDAAHEANLTSVKP